MAGFGADTWPLAALPIREQPDLPERAGTSPLEIVLLAGMLVAVLAMVRAIIRWRARQDLDRMGFDEQGARAEMDRLCADGWTATLTLYGKGAPLPAGRPRDEGAQVRIEWRELVEDDAGRREAAVTRRIWAPSVGTALRGMVDDRRLDFELEQIERAQAERDRSGGE